MPQNGPGVLVEAVDEVFQQQMKDLVGFRSQPENGIGWNHSYPQYERNCRNLFFSLFCSFIIILLLLLLLFILILILLHLHLLRFVFVEGSGWS
jgi:hypothetical protein